MTTTQTRKIYTAAEIKEALQFLGTTDVREACAYIDDCDYESQLVHCPVCDGVGHNCYYGGPFSHFDG
jgi:hypothetical protein